MKKLFYMSLSPVNLLFKYFFGWTNGLAVLFSVLLIPPQISLAAGKNSLSSKDNSSLESHSSFNSFADSEVSYNESSEEVTYDDLVHKLNQTKTRVQRDLNPHPFDSIFFHASFGVSTSVTNVHISGNNTYKYQNGFELGLGVDLFSPYWRSEATIRNFGLSQSGSENRSLREFDLKVFGVIPSGARANLMLGTGLGTRYFKLTDELNGLYINENTPVGIFLAAIQTKLNSNLSLCFEMGLRTSLISRTVDKNSADLGIKIDTAF